MKYRVGTSGWHYDHWRGEFYPADLPRPRWLEYYAKTFDTVELNASFYRLPTESAFAKWRNSAPMGFRYAVKASRFITHIKRLRNVEDELKLFLGRTGPLRDRLGPVLYQLPPGLKRDDSLLEAFLKLLPKELQHAFEFRNREWLDEGVFDLMRRYGAYFCVFDMPGLTTPVVATASFAYVRFHGHTALYYSNYGDEELAEWVGRIRALKGVSDVYVYFNNDAGGYAVENALTLRRMLT
ncbi:MAG: DUF72 domain-containing protein [Chloroflexota bacterium]